MNPESEHTKNSPPLVIPIAKLYCYESEYPCSETNFYTPDYYNPTKHPSPNFDIFNHLKLKETNRFKSFDDQWIQTSIGVPYDNDLIYTITSQWEQGNDVFLEFPDNKKYIKHKALVNGLLFKAQSNSTGNNEYYLKLRFYLNSSYFKPNTYIFPC